MGDVIYINPNAEDPFANVENTVREALELINDAHSAPWVVETIQRLCDIPELTFNLSMQFPGDLGEERSKQISDDYA